MNVTDETTRTVTMTMDESEAGIIRALLGACNSTGEDTFHMFEALPADLPAYNVRATSDNVLTITKKDW